MTTGRDIRALRRQRGLTLDELSAISGVHRDDLGGYERGEITPRPETVRKIAAALDAPIAAIRDGVGWTEPRPEESWETAGEETLLREGILESARAFWGEPAALPEEDIRALMASIRASVPALIEHMRDPRPEEEITRALLAELNALAPEEDQEDRVRRWALTDEQWERLRDLFPPENSGRGRALKSNRLMLDGILYWLRSGEPWAALPTCFGRSRCVAGRLALWQRTGVWRQALARMLAEGILRETDAAVALEQFSAEDGKEAGTDF